MGILKRLADAANVLVRPLGVRLVPTLDPDKRPWDRHFAQWLVEARRSGKDPNDIGDVSWADDPLRVAIQEHYLPHVRSDSVVLELGPGSGRLTRHVIGRCREMILVDYSRLVCDWLREYLRGKGVFRVHQIDRPFVPMVPDGSVDVVLANGVFEHLDMDEMLCFLEEFHRVLRPGGVVAFNFDNVMAAESIPWQRRWREGPSKRCIFRFYHPDAVSRLGEAAGFETLRLTTSSSRFAYIEIGKK